jgi:GT2 family glycosyltransferase
VVGLSGTVIPTGTDCFNIRYLQRRNPLVALGAELVGSPGAIGRLRRYLVGVTGMRPPLRSCDDLYAVVGANMAFRREAILALGGFDEAYRFGAEEEELCIRLHAQGTGHRLAFCAEARVAHHFRPELGDSLRRSRSYGRGNARRAITHPDTSPIVYPFPLLVAVTALAAVARARCDPRRALVAALMPLGLYPRWISDVRASGSAEPLAYPYVEMLQEIWTMRGEVDGYRARARTAASEPAARSARPRSTPAP